MHPAGALPSVCNLGDFFDIYYVKYMIEVSSPVFKWLAQASATQKSHIGLKKKHISSGEGKY